MPQVAPTAARPRPTPEVERHYDRIAPLYDALLRPFERKLRRWRRDLWAAVAPGRVLELGVGTGACFPFYPRQARVVGVDVSAGMLARAARRADLLGISVHLEQADAQALPYASESFDTVVGALVFCSVPDPHAGLAEALRVLRPGGRLLLLEHVLSRRRWLRWLMRTLQPLAWWTLRDHIDRDTAEVVRSAGFEEVEVAPRWLDVVVQIGARRT